MNKDDMHMVSNAISDYGDWSIYEAKWIDNYLSRPFRTFWGINNFLSSSRLLFHVYSVHFEVLVTLLVRNSLSIREILDR